jgi:putative oxidoreductase
MRPIIPFLAPLWAALNEPAYALMRLTAGAFLIPHGLWKLFGITGSQEEMLAFLGSASNRRG